MRVRIRHAGEDHDTEYEVESVEIIAASEARLSIAAAGYACGLVITDPADSAALDERETP
jgi:hypothetical protein